MSTLQPFAGSASEHVEHWLCTLESAAVLHSWNETRKLAAACALLVGPAAVWLDWQDIQNWQQFTIALVERFGWQRDDAWHNLKYIQQHANEDPYDYLDRLLFLAHSCEASGAALPDVMVRKLFIDGLQDNIRHRVKDRRPVSLEAAADDAAYFIQQLKYEDACNAQDGHDSEQYLQPRYHPRQGRHHRQPVRPCEAHPEAHPSIYTMHEAAIDSKLLHSLSQAIDRLSDCLLGSQPEWEVDDVEEVDPACQEEDYAHFVPEDDLPGMNEAAVYSPDWQYDPHAAEKYTPDDVQGTDIFASIYPRAHIDVQQGLLSKGDSAPCIHNMDKAYPDALHAVEMQVATAFPQIQIEDQQPAISMYLAQNLPHEPIDQSTDLCLPHQNSTSIAACIAIGGVIEQADDDSPSHDPNKDQQAVMMRQKTSLSLQNAVGPIPILECEIPGLESKAGSSQLRSQPVVSTQPEASVLVMCASRKPPRGPTIAQNVKRCKSTFQEAPSPGMVEETLEFMPIKLDPFCIPILTSKDTLPLFSALDVLEDILTVVVEVHGYLAIIAEFLQLLMCSAKPSIPIVSSETSSGTMLWDPGVHSSSLALVRPMKMLDAV